MNLQAHVNHKDHEGHKAHMNHNGHVNHNGREDQMNHKRHKGHKGLQRSLCPSWLLVRSGLFVLAMMSALPAAAAIDSNDASRLQEAARVIQAVGASVPSEYWNDARCVIVIPSVTKTAFIVGGEFGKGVMSCRAGASWSAPMFMELAKGSWGFQAGAEQLDLLMLVMNEDGVQKLLNGKVALGADASVAAGPVGRGTAKGTDTGLKAQMIAYSRARGLFAGVNLSGGVLRPDDEANPRVYGPRATARTILAGSRISAPTEAASFLMALDMAAQSNPERASKTNAPSAPAQASPAQPTNTAEPTTDSDLRTRIVHLRQMIDQLAAGSPAPVGTGGGNDGTITIERAKLMELRSELDALLAALNKR